MNRADRPIIYEPPDDLAGDPPPAPRAIARPVEDLQRAHDLLWTAADGEAPCPFVGVDLERMAGGLAVLCWALGHRGADGAFARTLVELEAWLSAQGLRMRPIDQVGHR